VASAVHRIVKCGMRNLRPSCDYHDSGGSGRFTGSTPVVRTANIRRSCIHTITTSLCSAAHAGYERDTAAAPMLLSAGQPCSNRSITSARCMGAQQRSKPKQSPLFRMTCPTPTYLNYLVLTFPLGCLQLEVSSVQFRLCDVH